MVDCPQVNGVIKKDQSLSEQNASYGNSVPNDIEHTSLCSDSIKKAKYLFIRHAHSTGNEGYELHGAESWSMEKLIDAKVTDFGEQQCYQSATKEYLTQIPFDTVLVSPLRRCIQTANYLLKDHPRFNEIKFIIVPYIREHLHTSGDIP